MDIVSRCIRDRATGFTDSLPRCVKDIRRRGIMFGLKHELRQQKLSTNGSSCPGQRRQIHDAWSERLKSYDWDWAATLTPRFAD